MEDEFANDIYVIEEEPNDHLLAWGHRDGVDVAVKVLARAIDLHHLEGQLVNVK